MVDADVPQEPQGLGCSLNGRAWTDRAWEGKLEKLCGRWGHHRSGSSNAL